MSRTDDLYCNRVIRSLEQIGRATMALHGRCLYNQYSMFQGELQRDICDLVHQGYMDTNLDPRLQANAIVLPGFSPKNARRIRYAWDYFIFIYMSHKIQNIKRRQPASASTGTQNILYLRGADYQLAISHDGAAVGSNTLQDAKFRFAILNRLPRTFDVVKALSPSDLFIAMNEIGFFLAEHGNSLAAVAEFARDYDGGFFFNPGNWKERVLELFPSSALFLVYVSNQSNGLSYELECLLSRELESNAILVLDDDRFGSRESFFSLQDRLRAKGEEVYLSVDRDACAVEDPDAFERLISRFPHRVDLKGDREIVLQEIEALIPTARRPDAVEPAEFAFEFRVALDAAAGEVDVLRRRVSDFIEDSFSRATVANWPVLLFHIEMDIFLNLAFGDILKAAVSTARYAAIADFTRDFVNQDVSGRAADLDPVLRQSGDLGMNVAYYAFAMGEWNDYGDRRALAREQIDATASEVTSLMRCSLEQADEIFMREAKEDAPHADESAYVDLLKSILEAEGMIEVTPS